MEIDRKALLDTLTLAFRAVDRKATIGPTAEVRFSGGQAPCLEATDGRIGLILPLVAGLGAQDAPGMIRRIVLDVLRLAPGDTVDVAGLPPERFGAGNGVRIAAGAYEAELIGSAVADFPDLPYGGEAVATFDVPALRSAFKVAVGVASRDETRPNLQAIHVECRDGAARLVATDGHRLYESAPCGAAAAGASSLLVRAPALRLALDVAAHYGADRIDLSRAPDGSAVFAAGDGVAVGSPTEAGYAFPDWRPPVAAALRTMQATVTADRDAWICAVRRSASHAGGAKRARADLRLTVGPSGARVGIDDVDAGAGSAGVEAADVRGEAEMTFTPTYVLAAFAGCAPGAVDVGVADSGALRITDLAGAWQIVMARNHEAVKRAAEPKAEREAA